VPSKDFGHLRLDPRTTPLLDDPVSHLSVHGSNRQIGGDLGLHMLDPDAPQAKRTATASGEQRATARRFGGTSLGDRDRCNIGQWNRMRQM
jgi:hypothetical protein